MRSSRRDDGGRTSGQSDRALSKADVPGTAASTVAPSAKDDIEDNREGLTSDCSALDKLKIKVATSSPTCDSEYAFGNGGNIKFAISKGSKFAEPPSIDKIMLRKRTCAQVFENLEACNGAQLDVDGRYLAKRNPSRSFHDIGSESVAGSCYSYGNEKPSGVLFTKSSSPLLSKPECLLDTESDAKNKKPRICDFYAKGWCIKGNSCMFLHHKSSDDVGQMSKIDVDQVAGKGQIHEVAGTVNSSMSKIDLSTRLLVREYGVNQAQYHQFSPLPTSRDEQRIFSSSESLFKETARQDILLHNMQTAIDDFPTFRRDWSSNRPLRHFEHLPLRRGDYNNFLIPTIHDQYPDRSYSMKTDVRNGDHEMDVLLRRGSPLSESKLSEYGSSSDKMQLSHDKSRVDPANLGFHCQFPFNGSSSNHGLSSLSTKQLGAQRSVDGDENCLRFRSPSITQSASPFLSHEGKPLHSSGFERQSFSSDWTPSIPFRSSIFPLMHTSSTGSQYDPLLDSMVSYDGGNNPTVASTLSSKEAKIKDMSQQKTNEIHVDFEKDIPRDEPVIAGDATEANSLGATAHKKLVTKKEKKKVDLGNNYSNDSGDRKLASFGSDTQKDSKALKFFRVALVDYVKELLKPSWREGHLSKDAHNTIVKKSVDKVLSSLQSHQIPSTTELTNQYLSLSRPKLTKLIEGYVEKYSKASSSGGQVS